MPWRALPQLLFEVPPFVKELASGFADTPFEFPPTNFCSVEFIPAGLGFGGDGAQEHRDGCPGVRLCLKPLQLRVMTVTTCSAGKHFLGKQRFTPGGHQAFGIEVTRMNGPQSHFWRSPVLIVSG